MTILENLKPKEVFYYFEQISNIPRGSGNEKRISDYLVEFSKLKGLEYIQDDSLNVIIKKPGSKGYENSAPVIIQGHMDMVCEKNSDKTHDFEKDPIALIIEGDYIKADRTTLGADNGIAVAYILAILSSDERQHPPIEAVFTADEEVGMNGAYALDTSHLKGRMLINVDSEDEGKLLASCAGGMRATIHVPIKFENYEEDKTPYAIKIRGLKGGHSGSEIDKQRANANKLMGRVLSVLFEKFEINLVAISGGAKDNAIPREADTTIVAKPSELPNIIKITKELQANYKNEFKNCDSDIKIEVVETQKPHQIFDRESTKRVIDTSILIPNGVSNMSLDIKGLVESSTNIGVVSTLDSEVTFTSATRSSVSTRKDEIRDQMQHLSGLIGGSLTIRGEYPAWEYDPNSKLRAVFVEVYEALYGKTPEIEAIHAGLECGLFAKKMPGIDMISLGPDMADVHTPDEKLSISSTARTWDYLIEVLKALK